MAACATKQDMIEIVTLRYHIVASTNTSQLVTPHVTNSDKFNSWHGVSKNKQENVQSLRYSGYLTNKNILFLKKIGVWLFETVKNLICWIVTRVSTRDTILYAVFPTKVDGSERIGTWDLPVTEPAYILCKTVSFESCGHFNLLLSTNISLISPWHIAAKHRGVIHYHSVDTLYVYLMQNT